MGLMFWTSRDNLRSGNWTIVPRREMHTVLVLFYWFFFFFLLKWKLKVMTLCELGSLVNKVAGGEEGEEKSHVRVRMCVEKSCIISPPFFLVVSRTREDVSLAFFFAHHHWNMRKAAALDVGNRHVQLNKT